MRGAQQLPRAWGLSLLRVTTSGAACSHTFVIGACISVSASISLHQFTFYPNYLPGINILLFNFILRGHQPPPRGHQSLATYYFFRKIVSGGECPEKVRHLHQTTAVLRRGWGGVKETRRHPQEVDWIWQSLKTNYFHITKIIFLKIIFEKVMVMSFT